MLQANPSGERAETHSNQQGSSCPAATAAHRQTQRSRAAGAAGQPCVTTVSLRQGAKQSSQPIGDLVKCSCHCCCETSAFFITE
jgi:hypothetical protein